MNNSIGYGSRETKISVSHVTDGNLVFQIRRRIDGKRDRLDWICVPLRQIARLENEAQAAVIEARHPRAANDDPARSSLRKICDNGDRAVLSADKPA